MSSRLTIAVSVLAGVAVGATAVGTLRAQGKGPVYVVTDFSEVTDAAGFAAASKGVPAAIAAGGGKVLARTDSVTALDGAGSKRIAIFAFDSVEKAKAWYASDAMKEAQAGRAKFTKSRTLVFEGLPN
jgi:uncharacterized protein (DUF1330 family)